MLLLDCKWSKSAKSLRVVRLILSAFFVGYACIANTLPTLAAKVREVLDEERPPQAW